ncbi:Pentatricopeptide repeat-containing protein 5, mitochondrial [Grifola frondosa]|uniref:Pentatricopeptide repeat-containing protein 5, mitochondrial n=1 Tax=Grifola frondosa TaxID=5627 RepID=A0A1C7LRK6_GRIFR|nr:Pentatricopeptide repeat-containing protein 5, mitochondrial [Grifola frondosa]
MSSEWKSILQDKLYDCSALARLRGLEAFGRPKVVYHHAAKSRQSHLSPHLQSCGRWGARFHSSSRFHSGSVTTGRNTTQAHERPEKLGVLRAVQLHQRARHVERSSTDTTAPSVLPGFGTYTTLISALTDRDYQNHQDIVHAEARIRKRSSSPAFKHSTDAIDEQRIASLRADNHFTPAIALFQTASTNPKSRIPLHIYNKLLRSCAIHSNADAAISIFAHLEKRSDILPDAQTFIHLLVTYMGRGDLQGAKEIFEEFREASKLNRIRWAIDELVSDEQVQKGPFRERAAQIAVWNQMIETYFRCGQPITALGLLEQMLDSKVGETFNPADIPPPASSTFSRTIRGFTRSNDVKTALSWFDRLLQQDLKPGHPYAPTPIPSRPDQAAWTIILDALASSGMIEDLNRLFLHLTKVASDDGLSIWTAYRETVSGANLNYLETNADLDPSRAYEVLDFIATHVLGGDHIRETFMFDREVSRGLCERLILQYWVRGYRDRALELAEEFVEQQWRLLLEAADLVPSHRARFRAQEFSSFARSLTSQLLAKNSEDLSEEHASRVAALFATSSLEPQSPVQPNDHLTSPHDTVIDDTPSTPPTSVRIDSAHSTYVNAFALKDSSVSPLAAYSRFHSASLSGIYPDPGVMARLISALGRLGQVEKMQHLYQSAQLVLNGMEHSKEKQSAGWFDVEDHMIIGLAFAGDVNAAHTHRRRIIEQGGVPSADAYGALIHHVKDTTDDTSNAMVLFQESQALGVSPNIFMYNTVISKLAKARKADYALEVFQDMKAHRVQPTSVTYGAVIAACCRVGDAPSAEILFEEMTSQRNFKPRVPPYNTMMQLYTHTKPDRSRVLHYYNALRDAKVQPTAHTYKVGLLLDAYGCIEPIDLNAMESVFERLIAEPNVAVQGTHWAALINAWGCVQKDLDKALSIFDSIADHPTTKRTGASLPDAVVFEALMNTLITLRRADLIPAYTERLQAYGVHMTAYIANLLIKGYASAGDIERSRNIFEGLQDPPEGIAAPHNHIPHEDKPDHIATVPASAPVFREPSTWEAMVRAELGNGQRDRAVALLKRLQARMFPLPVYQRISGIMLDNTVSPWSSPDSMTPYFTV